MKKGKGCTARSTQTCHLSHSGNAASQSGTGYGSSICAARLQISFTSAHELRSEATPPAPLERKKKKKINEK